MSLIPRGLFGPSKDRMDPAWRRRVERRYDEKGGYRAYHAHCREHCPHVAADAAAPVVRTGYERVPVMPEREAAAIEGAVLERFASHPGAEKSRHLSVFDIDDPDFERDLLERILTPEVDRRAMAFFGSEFFVYWYTVSRSVAVPELGLNSFRWHCDRGPSGHLKLLFYLNGFEAHGGGTSFLDLETTRRIATSGYVFAPVKTRLEDLGPLARQCGADYAPWFAEMKAGEGILFQPAGVLHRGQLSTSGPRHVVTLCLLPSPVPWRAALERDVMARNVADDKWHAHASHFQEALSR